MAINPQAITTTGEVRLSFCKLFEPNDKGKRTCQLLIRKDDTLTLERFRKAIQTAYTDGKGVLGGTPLKKASPLHDGDEERDTEQYPEFAGHWYLNVSTKHEPGLFGPEYGPRNEKGKRRPLPLPDPGEWYSGCYVKATVAFVAYDFKENGASVKKGITGLLYEIQKLRDGEPLGGGAATGSSFEEDAPPEQDDLGFVEIL